MVDRSCSRKQCQHEEKLYHSCDGQEPGGNPSQGGLGVQVPSSQIPVHYYVLEQNSAPSSEQWRGIPPVQLLKSEDQGRETAVSFKRMDSVVRMLPYVSLEGKNCIADIVGDLVTNQAKAQLVLNSQTHEYLLKLLDSASHGPAVRALTSIAVHSSSLRGILASDSNLRKIIPKLAVLELSDIADAARYIGVVVRENVAHQN
ncbi:hypothetical protein BSKO_04561 [Bryopsis sp. KO-2023]|nr:hypothetical protein BSKO_04561 [Bryopsis sp. KO-2023]